MAYYVDVVDSNVVVALYNQCRYTIDFVCVCIKLGGK